MFGQDKDHWEAILKAKARAEENAAEVFARRFPNAEELDPELLKKIKGAIEEGFVMGTNQGLRDAIATIDNPELNKRMEEHDRNNPLNWWERVKKD